MKEEENDVLEFPEDPDVEEETAEASDEIDNAEERSDKEAEDDEASKIREVEDRYVRLFAEYDNFRKRTAKEKEDLYRSAVVDVTKEWLSVLDNIDRAIEAANKAADEDGEKSGSEDKMLQGLELIRKQAVDVLSKLNVTEIPCERGTAFDPNLHEAVMHTEDDSLGQNEVAAVFQKGFILKDRVVRHAVVQVAN